MNEEIWNFSAFVASKFPVWKFQTNPAIYTISHSIKNYFLNINNICKNRDLSTDVYKKVVTWQFSHILTGWFWDLLRTLFFLLQMTFVWLVVLFTFPCWICFCSHKCSGYIWDLLPSFVFLASDDICFFRVCLFVCWVCVLI